MAETKQHAYKIKKKIPKRYKGIVVNKDNPALKFKYYPTDVDYVCHAFEDAFSQAIFDFTPAFEKDFLEELKYWRDPAAFNVSYEEVLPYQTAFDFPYLKDGKRNIASGVTTYFPDFNGDERIMKDFFKGKITKHVEKDNEEIIYRGNDPEFRQFYGIAIPNIYPDGIYVGQEVKDGVPTEFVLYVRNENDDAGDNEYYLDSNDEELGDLARAYPYTAKLLTMGKYITIEGIDKLLNTMMETEEVAIQTDKDFYFVANVGDIKNSPTHGQKVSFIYIHDTEADDYGYYY